MTKIVASAPDFVIEFFNIVNLNLVLLWIPQKETFKYNHYITSIAKMQKK